MQILAYNNIFKAIFRWAQNYVYIYFEVYKLQPTSDKLN